MKRAIGQFLFDLMVRTVNYFDDETYDKFMATVFRPAFTRKRPLPNRSGREIRIFHYESPDQPRP